MRKMRYEVFIKEVLSGWDAEGSGGGGLLYNGGLGARGILDESFATGGVVILHLAVGGDYSDYGKSVCLDGSHYNMALWRYK